MLTVWSSFIRTDHRSTTRQVQKLNSNIIFRGRNPPKTVRYQFGCSDKCLQGHSHCYSYQRNSGIPTESDPTTPIPRNRQTRNRIVTRSTNCPCKVPQLLFYKAQQLYNQDHKHTKRRWRMRKLLPRHSSSFRVLEEADAPLCCRPVGEDPQNCRVPWPHLNSGLGQTNENRRY